LFLKLWFLDNLILMTSGQAQCHLISSLPQ
jgi:hypothetical protein